MPKIQTDLPKSESTWLLRIFAVGWIVIVLIILINIVTSPTNLGTLSTESAIVTRANERLLEMVKWTISTILLVGGGLIGLNWYQNERRIEEKFTEFQSTFIDFTKAQSQRSDQLEKKLSAFQTQIDSLDQEVSTQSQGVTPADLRQKAIYSELEYIESIFNFDYSSGVASDGLRKKVDELIALITAIPEGERYRLRHMPQLMRITSKMFELDMREEENILRLLIDNHNSSFR